MVGGLVTPPSPGGAPFPPFPLLPALEVDTAPFPPLPPTTGVGGPNKFH